MADKPVHIEELGIEAAFTYDFSSHGEIFWINSVGVCEELRQQNGFASLLFCNEMLPDNRELPDDAAVICFDEKPSVTGVFRRTSAGWTNREGEICEQPDLAGMHSMLVVNCGQSFDAEKTAETVFGAFKQGDAVRFRQGTKGLSPKEIEELFISGEEGKMQLRVNNPEFSTVRDTKYTITGRLISAVYGKGYVLRVNVSDGKSERTENFYIVGGEPYWSVEIVLNKGVNYISCEILSDGLTETDIVNSHIVFVTGGEVKVKDRIMWVEQYVNSQTTNSADKIEELTAQALQAGITSFALDLKGVEGYCSYKKSFRTGVPYMTETPNPKKKIDMDIDFLEEFIAIAHAKGIKVYGSFNFFVEGNLMSRDSAIKISETHPDWAEMLYAPEDGGRIVSVLESKKNSALCYVNPANREVWAFEAERVREVLENYDVDGIIMDRTRYDNCYADFSDVTRVQFEDYLKKRGKSMEKWPEDIYRFSETGAVIQGPLYIEWFTFRSSVIRDFSIYLKGVVDEYRDKGKRDIKLAAYVGSWYDLYYQNGVNWGDKSFVYNNMLKFPLPQLYTEEYAETSYLDNIDFLMTGCYYETAEMIDKYVTISNIVTNGKIPVIASVSLPHLTTEEALNVAIDTCLDRSDGLMIFDLCYTDWKALIKAMNYVCCGEKNQK